MFTTQSVWVPSYFCFRTRDLCSRRKNFWRTVLWNMLLTAERKNRELLYSECKMLFPGKAPERKNTSRAVICFLLCTFIEFFISLSRCLSCFYYSFTCLSPSMRLWILEDKVYHLLLSVFTKIISSLGPGTFLAFIKHWLNEWINK